MLPERTLSGDVADLWIREALSLHPGGAELTVSGTCMEPAIMEGARIQIRRPSQAPRAGDVLLVSTPAGLRLHRVIFRQGETVRTKGDKGRFLDPPIPDANVLAFADSGETRGVRFARTFVSALRLALRFGLAPGSDRAHAAVLPSRETVKYAPDDPVPSRFDS